MDGLAILIAYIAILAVQIALLVTNILRPRIHRWVILWGMEVLSAVGAWMLMRHFDGLPGSGKAPGLTYFAETLFSMGASAAYCVMLGLSAAAAVTVHMISRRKQSEK